MKTPRLLLATIVWFAVTALGFGQDAPAAKATIKLVSGEVMTGTVGAVRDGSLSLITEYGPVRIPVDKISPESKAKLGISSAAANAEAMTVRISELENLVEKLREENAALRRNAAAPPVQPVIGGSGISGNSGAASKTGATAGNGSEAAGAHRMSTTGKRHNSNCRYFDSKGRACGPNEGVACKICGG